jgi:hypothetical protein
MSEEDLTKSNSIWFAATVEQKLPQVELIGPLQVTDGLRGIHDRI